MASRKSSEGTSNHKLLWQQPYLWLAIALLLIGFALLTYRLNEVPLGWHHDESVKGIMAREVLEGTSRPIFFQAYTGREPLYIYLSAAYMSFLGDTIFAVRVNSVFVGILTAAVTFALARTMFGPRVAILALAFVSFSLWHIIASRNGYRAVSQPLLEALTAWMLWRGLRDGKAFEFILGGALLGLTLYTYTASRAFLLLLILFCGLQLAANFHWLRKHTLGLVLFFAIAVVVTLPLGIHFLQNPGDFFGRAEQVSVLNPALNLGDPMGRLRASILETLAIFSFKGDPNYRFNLDSRPIYDPLSALFFYLGTSLCLIYIFKSQGTARAGYFLVPLWLLFMLLPAALSAEDTPASQRAIGIQPAVYIAPALGLAWAVERLPRAFRGWPVVGLLVLFFAYQSVSVYNNYFHRWAQSPVAYEQRQASMTEVARYLQNSPWRDLFYISSDYPQHPTVAFLAPKEYDRSHWFDARQSIALPPQGRTAMYIFTSNSPPAGRLLEPLPGLRRLEDTSNSFGQPIFTVYSWNRNGLRPPLATGPVKWSPEIDFPPGDPRGLRRPLELPVNFGDEIAYIGYWRSGDTLDPGDKLEVVLYWRILRKPTREYSIFVHLLSPQGQVVGQADANRYPSASWERGETLLGYYSLNLAPSAPSGETQLEIGVYYQPTGERLPILDKGLPVADRLLLPPLTVR